MPADSGRHCRPEIFQLSCFHDSTAAQREETATALYIGGSALVLASNAIWQWDTDPGGYPMGRIYPSKQGLHLLIASTLTIGASAIGVKPWTAAGITCASGAGYELTQGHVNGLDIAADCAGAALGALLVKWVRAPPH